MQAIIVLLLTIDKLSVCELWQFSAWVQGDALQINSNVWMEHPCNKVHSQFDAISHFHVRPEVESKPRFSLAQVVHFFSLIQY